MEVEQISTFEFEDSVNVQIDKPAALNNTQNETDGNVGEERDPKTAKKQEITASSCPVEGVTVFLDRAEVRRTVDANLKAGENEILITGLPTVMDEDSIRVTCLGDAKIIEVSFKTKTSYVEKLKDPNPEETKSEMETLKESKLDLENKISQTKDRIKLLEKEKSFLGSYGERLRPCDKANDKLVESFDKKSLESVAAFLGFYRAQGQKLYDELFESKAEIDTLEKKIKQIDERLNELLPLCGSSGYSFDDKRVLILLEAEQDVRLQLILSYVVSHASWTPLYDIRAFSQDNSLQLLYFGTVKQKTGEDWNDAKLSLSTAMPSVGGSPPDLETLHIHTVHHQKKRYRERRALLNAGLADYAECEQESLCYSLMPDEPKRASRSFSFKKQRSERQYIPSEVKEGITSTNFEIARTSTIKSDDSGHKVSIGQIDLKPTFEYDSVPKLVDHAFLTAKIKNESNYALLEGPANVFLDNNFLTKTNMDAVSPLEEFEVSLGVDPAVKVTYKPLKKFVQRTGVVTKYTQTQYHQQIIIKNTKSSAVKIRVTDQLPKSSEEKLKVILTEPVIPTQKTKNEIMQDQPIKLTDKNHIEWNVEIEASKTKEFNIKYTIEHPVNLHVSGV